MIVLSFPSLVDTFKPPDAWGDANLTGAFPHNLGVTPPVTLQLLDATHLCVQCGPEQCAIYTLSSSKGLLKEWVLVSLCAVVTQVGVPDKTQAIWLNLNCVGPMYTGNSLFVASLAPFRWSSLVSVFLLR